jgi:hypothetical protein
MICYNILHCSQKATSTLVLECYDQALWKAKGIRAIFISYLSCS